MRARAGRSPGAVPVPISIAMPLLRLIERNGTVCWRSRSDYKSPSRSSRSRAPVLLLRCRTAESTPSVSRMAPSWASRAMDEARVAASTPGSRSCRAARVARSDAEQGLDDPALDGASVEQAAQPGSDGLAAQRPDDAVVEGEGVLGSHLPGREPQVTAALRTATAPAASLSSTSGRRRLARAVAGSASIECASARPADHRRRPLAATHRRCCCTPRLAVSAGLHLPGPTRGAPPRRGGFQGAGLTRRPRRDGIFCSPAACTSSVGTEARHRRGRCRPRESWRHGTRVRRPRYRRGPPFRRHVALSSDRTGLQPGDRRTAGSPARAGA